MMHARLPDWPARLAAFIEERRHAPFKWGVNDCGLFAADATAAITGVDPEAKIRGYRTAIGAARIAGRSALSPVSCPPSPDTFGVRELPAICGFTELPVKMAQRGDLVMLPMGRGRAIGVCLGVHSAGPGAAGLEFVPTSTAVAAWRY